MSAGYLNYSDKELFGNDAADAEDEGIFESYAIERKEISDFLNSRNAIQVARAFKGEGKSALLRIVSYKLGQQYPDAIRISTTGVATSPALETLDSDIWTREWKKNLLKIIAVEVGSKINLAFTDDAISLVEEAEANGFKQRSIVSAIFDRLKSKAVPIERKTIAIENHELILQRYLDNDKKIWLIIDDVDQNFKNTELYKVKVASFFTACRQIVAAVPEIRIRTCVRPNVWKIVKREYEALSHIEQYMYDINWNLDDITQLLTKRIEGYIQRNELSNTYHSILTEANADIKSKRILSLVFEENMPWGGGGRLRPTNIVLNTLCRGRPRWLIELCKVSASSAAIRHVQRIDFTDIGTQLEEFGKRRIDDTIAEFSSQCPQIEEVITAFSRQNERYSTADLLVLIDNKILQGLNLKIFGILGKPNSREVAHFLFQIGFITARRDMSDVEYEHISFHQQPDLLKSRTNVDDGMSWEIHPVFRQALALKNIDTRQQQAHANSRRRNTRN